MRDRTTKALVTGAAGWSRHHLLSLVLSAAFARYQRRLARGSSRRGAVEDDLRLPRQGVIAILITIGDLERPLIFRATNKSRRRSSPRAPSRALRRSRVHHAALEPRLRHARCVQQPLRLGDRVTIGEHTGFVEAMTLIYTTLVTDDARRVFIPNSQLTQPPIVNRTIRDPRRAAGARLPIGIDTPIAEARAALLTAIAPFEDPSHDTSRVLIDEVTENTVWLDVTVYAPINADVSQLSSQVREAGLEALRERGFLRS